jgi:hypothetical protein
MTVVTAPVTPGANHATAHGDGEDYDPTQRNDSTEYSQEVLHLAAANKGI